MILGVSQSGPLAALYTATNPRRTDALILYASYAAASAKPDYPWGRSPDWIENFHHALDTSWGEGAFLLDVAPSLQHDPAFSKWWGRFERYSSAPSNALAFGLAHAQDDVRNVLETIAVPTLVIQRDADSYRDVGHGRYRRNIFREPSTSRSQERITSPLSAIKTSSWTRSRSS